MRTALFRFWFSLRALVARRRLDDELDEELAFHLERETAVHERGGMTRADARREAMRRFGGLQRVREECRDVRHLSWLHDLLTDIHFAFRLARHYPGFSANVILIAALGIAACATTFSLVSGILLSPLPFSAPDRVMSLHLRSEDGDMTAAFPRDAYLRLAAGSPAVEAIAAYSPGGAAVDWSGEPERISAEQVTPSFFRVFGIAPLVGRPFTEQEGIEQSPVALLGHELWRTRFGGDSAVLGRRLSLDGKPYTVIGVMPPRFRAHLTNEPDVWLPLSVTGADAATPQGRSTVNAVLRIAEEVTPQAAEAWLATNVRARMESNTVRDSVSAAPSLLPIAELVYGYVRRPLLVLLGAVGLVQLLVAANVATMFLARSAARERELGVRRALGAGAGRQIRQLVTEAVALTAVGGLLGVGVSYWAVGVIRDLGAEVLPRMDAVALDWRVALFAAAGTVLTGVVGGLAPALAAQYGEARAMRDASDARATGHRASSALVVAQIALSVVLLVGGGLLVKGFLRVLPDDPGFALENRALLVVRLRDQQAIADSTPVAARAFVRDVIERMRSVASVTDVAAMSFAPFYGSVSIADIDIPDRPAPERPFTAYQNLITPNYFELMRIPLRLGRSFTSLDVSGAEPVAIVNETAATRWWPGENPIGKPVSIQHGERFSATVIGLARDGRLRGSDTRPRPEIYLPVAQSHPRFITFIVHTTVPPRGIARDLQRSIWEVAPRLPIGTTSDLATVASESVREERFFSVAMSAFALAAVGLTGLGIYGLLAFAVARRRREIGIRIALGAPARTVGALVLRRALLMGLAGVGIGIVLAGWLSRYMESLLREVAATDATVFAASGMAVLLLAVAAACAPMFQAVRVDPIKSLRVQ